MIALQHCAQQRNKATRKTRNLDRWMMSTHRVLIKGCGAMFKVNKPSFRNRSPRATFAPRMTLGILACLAASGCVSLENEEGRLPDAMRAAVANLSAKGYPDLTKLPEKPTDLPPNSVWTNLEAGLVEQGKQLSNNPEARPPTPEDTNLDWAEAQRRALNADPRAEPVPPVPIGTESEVEWATKAKAKLDADLARLPPP
jgi:hypothetical protein